MKLKVGDKVKVIAGANKGKEGKIIETLKNENRVVVENVNMIKKHVKPNGGNAGSIVDKEAPIHASNVKLVDAKDAKEVKKTKTTKETKDTKVSKTKKSSGKLD